MRACRRTTTFCAWGPRWRIAPANCRVPTATLSRAGPLPRRRGAPQPSASPRACWKSAARSCTFAARGAAADCLVVLFLADPVRARARAGTGWENRRVRWPCSIPTAAASPTAAARQRLAGGSCEPARLGDRRARLRRVRTDRPRCRRGTRRRTGAAAPAEPRAAPALAGDPPPDAATRAALSAGETAISIAPRRRHFTCSPPGTSCATGDCGCRDVMACARAYDPVSRASTPRTSSASCSNSPDWAHAMRRRGRPN